MKISLNRWKLERELRYCSRMVQQKNPSLKTLSHLLQNHVPQSLHRALESHLTNLPARYFRGFDPQDICADLSLTERLASEPVIVAVTVLGGKLTLRVLMAKDEPKIFLRVVGVLARHKISIDRAAIFTGLTDGLVLDHFALQKPVEPAVMELASIEVQAALITGHFDPPELPPAETMFLSVNVENLKGAKHTTVTVNGVDQIGFLYRIADVFVKQELNLSYARIRTHLGKALDTFHVTAKEGHN